MKRLHVTAAIVALMLGCPAAAQEIQWTQVLNVPKGQNLPKGLVVDMLGIELGESYVSAKAKIAKLHRDSPAPAAKKQIEEVERVINMQLPNNNTIRARFPGFIDLKTETPGAGARPIGELLSVYFSAPSSGQQVIGLGRIIDYNDRADQPRIADIIASMKAKFRAEPQVYPNPGVDEVQFVFVNGNAVNPAAYHKVTCNADHGIQRDLATSSGDVPRINRDGKCDIVLRVILRHGISPEHADRVWFLYSDAMRTKANLAADYEFFGNYVRQMQQQTKGAAPKL